MTKEEEVRQLKQEIAKREERKLIQAELSRRQASDSYETRDKNLLEKAGMVGRAALSAAATIPDLVTLPVTVPTMLMGGPDLVPSSLVKRGIDKLTNNRLAPTTRGEKVLSGAIEWGTPGFATKGIVKGVGALAPKLAELAEKGSQSVAARLPTWWGQKLPKFAKSSIAPTLPNVVGGGVGGAVSGMMDGNDLASALPPIAAGILASGTTRHLMRPGALQHPLQAVMRTFNPVSGLKNQWVGPKFMKDLPARLGLNEVLRSDPESAGQVIHKGSKRYEETMRKKHNAQWGQIDKLGKNVRVNIHEPLNEVVSILESFKDPALRNEFMTSPVGKELLRLSGLSEIRHIDSATKVELGKKFLRGLGEDQRIKTISARELEELGGDAIQELGLNEPISPKNAEELRDFGRRVAQTFRLRPKEGGKFSDYELVKIGQDHYDKWGRKLKPTSASEFLEAYRENPHITNRDVSFNEARKLRESVDNTLSQKQFQIIGDNDDRQIKAFRHSLATSMENQAKEHNPQLYNLVKKANKEYSYYADVEQPKLNILRQNEHEPAKTWTAANDLGSPGAYTARFVNKTLEGVPEAGSVSESWIRDLGRKGDKFDLPQFAQQYEKLEQPGRDAILSNLQGEMRERIAKALRSHHTYEALDHLPPTALDVLAQREGLSLWGKVKAAGKKHTLGQAFRSQTGQQMMEEYLDNPEMYRAIAPNIPPSNKKGLAVQGMLKKQGEPSYTSGRPLKVQVGAPTNIVVAD